MWTGLVTTDVVPVLAQPARVPVSKPPLRIGLLTGAVLTETVFVLPGMGTAMVNGIMARDYPIIQGFTIIIALIFVFSNLIVDVSYAYLDPRIRLE